MRKRIWIICIAGLALCLSIVLLSWTKHQNTELTAESTTLTNQTLRQSEPPTLAEPSQIQSPIGKTTTVPPQMPSPPPTPFSPDVVGPNALTNWQAPIEFYGKVVDENTNPVAGAKIIFHWVEVPTEEGNRTTNTESDAGGLFSLNGARGPSLSISVNKEGYYTSRRDNDSASYGPLGAGNFSPDSRNPVIFHLRKKGQGAELITSDNGIRPNLAVRLAKNNVPVRVDFFKKQAGVSGELEISQDKPPWQEATVWSFRMSILDGGFVENEDQFQFEAPEKNYQQTVEYRFKKGEANWATQVTKQFYIAFGQPLKYGWLRIESNLAQETIFITYVINPSGSRNLEPSN